VREYVKQHSYGNATADDFWTTLAKVSKRPVDQIMPTWVKQAGVPIVNVKAQCSANSTSVTLSQQRYYYDRAKFEAGNDQLWQIPVCLRASSTNSAKCELLTKKEQTFILPGCSTWVLANANAAGYYRAGYQAEAVRAMAKDAEGKFSPAERITLEADIWASVRVGRDSVGDYLAFAQGLQPDRTRAVMQSVLGRFNYIGQYLVNENDRDSYRAWLRQYLTPIAKDIGWEPKPGESDEQKTLRAGLLNALGYDARDSETLVQARKIAERALNDPTAVDQDLATGAIGLAALNGDQAFYDRIMAELKNPKSPELYYMYFYTLPQFTDPKLLHKTLDYAVSPDVRSQDALGLITSVMANPAGETLAWDFVLTHWDAVQKVGGPFASAQVVGATSSFCDSHMRDQVADFYSAHKIEAAERTYRQSIERINNCVDLKTQQEPQLASWLGQHGSSAGGQ
jgi:aminopeptidase N/puromycin-sensitive aminopeptidase